MEMSLLHMKQRIKFFAAEIKEIFTIMKVSLTTFWFWVPVLYAAYFYIQFWMLVYINPLTILILPVIISLYAVYLEEQRLKAKYDFDEMKTLSTSQPSGKNLTVTQCKWKIEKLMAEYLHFLKKKEKNSKLKKRDQRKG